MMFKGGNGESTGIFEKATTGELENDLTSLRAFLKFIPETVINKPVIFRAMVSGSTEYLRERETIAITEREETNAARCQ